MESSEKNCGPPVTRNHEDLLSLAAQRVRDGNLPRDYEARLFAGPGRGMPCALCGDAIGLTDIEYEVESSKFESTAKLARFHRACYFAWLQACE